MVVSAMVGGRGGRLRTTGVPMHPCYTRVMVWCGRVRRGVERRCRRAWPAVELRADGPGWPVVVEVRVAGCERRVRTSQAAGRASSLRLSSPLGPFPPDPPTLNPPPNTTLHPSPKATKTPATMRAATTLNWYCRVRVAEPSKAASRVERLAVWLRSAHPYQSEQEAPSTTGGRVAPHACWAHAYLQAGGELQTCTGWH